MKWLCTLVLLCAAQLACAQGQTLRCTDPDGAVIYQQTPCAAGQQSRAFPVLVDPPMPVAVATPEAKPVIRARTRRAVRTPSPPKPRRARRQPKLHVVPSLAQAGCPPTRENSGVYVVGNKTLMTPSGARGKVHNGMSAAWRHYKSLPSKTYLKNQGTWPDHCGD